MQPPNRLSLSDVARASNSHAIWQFHKNTGVRRALCRKGLARDGFCRRGGGICAEDYCERTTASECRFVRFTAHAHQKQTQTQPCEGAGDIDPNATRADGPFRSSCRFDQLKLFTGVASFQKRSSVALFTLDEESPIFFLENFIRYDICARHASAAIPCPRIVERTLVGDESTPHITDL